MGFRYFGFSDVLSREWLILVFLCQCYPRWVSLAFGSSWYFLGIAGCGFPTDWCFWGFFFCCDIGLKSQLEFLQQGLPGNFFIIHVVLQSF